MRRVEWRDLTLDSDEIYRAMGYGRARKNETIIEMVNSLRSKAIELINVQCLYDIVSIQLKEQKQILLDHNSLITCSGKFFEGATHAAIGVITIGLRLEEKVSSLFDKGETLEALIYDAFGTAAVDESLGKFRREIAEQVSVRGQQIGYNVSPGGKIPIEDQKVIFSFLKPDQIGVELTDSFLMVPVKSTSVLIPIGENLTMPNLSYCTTCEFCSGRNTCSNSRFKNTKI